VKEAIESAEARQLPEFPDALRAEDVFELELYQPHPFATAHPLYGDLRDLYWRNAARLAPYLDAKSRTELYSLLWGKIPQFTSLFLELKQALDLIGHREWAFVRLNSISDRLPGRTVLHVETMKQGLADNLAMSEMGEIAVESGQTFNIRKPVITALACELRAQLSSKPWDFFESTDLLDFPGARSRKGQRRDQFFSDQSEPCPIGEAFLRGKVAVMFDNYASDLDLNTLVACHRAEQNSVVSFPGLVEDWVKRTHGATAAERQGRRVNLFMAVTFCDRLFDQSLGQARLDVSLNNQLSFLSSFSDSIAEWAPGQPFRNTYLVRNPAGKKLGDWFEIEEIDDVNYVETAVRADRKERLEEYRRRFLETEIAQTFFDEADERFRAILEPNDGGVSYLARALGPACNAGVKYEQILPKASSLRTSVYEALSPFHEGYGAEERVAQREAAINEIIEILRQDLSSIPRFVTEFHCHQGQISRLYTNFKQTNLLGVRNNDEAPPTFGDIVLRGWASSLERTCADADRAARYRLKTDQMKRVAGELEAAFRMVDMAANIQEAVDRIAEFSPGSPRHADQVGASVEVMINTFVSYLGCAGSILISEQPAGKLFEQEPALSKAGFPELKPRLGDMAAARTAYMTDWLAALTLLTRTNARSTRGGLIDLEQNARLGDILKDFEGVRFDER
jgi:hypothetical protein